MVLIKSKAAAKSADKTALTPMQKVFASEADEKRRSMFLYVAREVTGRALQRKRKEEDKSLSWDKFNQNFNRYYADYSADELLNEILSLVYWLSSEQAVIELYFRYINDANKERTKKSADGEFDLDELDD